MSSPKYNNVATADVTLLCIMRTSRTDWTNQTKKINTTNKTKPDTFCCQMYLIHQNNVQDFVVHMLFGNKLM